jgi:ribonuclease G
LGKEILVNSAARETRIAVLDDRHLVELRVEREELVVGNIFKGRVENVLPGMDAAFVDIGLERNAFLYVADILPEYVEPEFDSSSRERGTANEPDASDESDDADARAALEIENDDEPEDVQAAAEAALAVEIASLSEPAVAPEAPVRQERAPGGRPRHAGRGRAQRRQVPIQELVSVRQELMVQVVKGPRGTKGSRVSTRMSLPGRYLVLMPDANNLGVSRKIDDSKERDRLKRIVEKFRVPGFGIIVRTEAEGRKASDLYQDFHVLLENWQNVLAKAKITPAPALIHQDMSLIFAIVRDAFGSDIEKLTLDSPADYLRAHEIIERISPDLADRIHLYDGPKPLFEQYKIEDDIERLLRRKVWLKSGGYLVIDQTEALTSIDVNTGKFTGSTGLAETILQTNIEATHEIARQLRLRDIGGMIILDFIDMDTPRDKKQVTDALTRALKNDRSRTKISSISPLGLIEMTRKRTRETVDVALTDTCPYCHGLGRVPSAETVSMQVEREMLKLANSVSSDAVVISAHPDVIACLIGTEGENIDVLERRMHRMVYARAQQHWHVEKYEVEPGTPSKIEQVFPVPRRGAVVECAVTRNFLSPLPWASAHLAGGYQVDIVNGGKFLGQNVTVRLQSVGRSLAIGEAIAGGGQRAQQSKPDRQQTQGQGKSRPPQSSAG